MHMEAVRAGESDHALLSRKLFVAHEARCLAHARRRTSGTEPPDWQPGERGFRDGDAHALECGELLVGCVARLQSVREAAAAA